MSVVLSKTAERSLRILTLKKLYTFKLGEHIEEEEGEEGGRMEGATEGRRTTALPGLQVKQWKVSIRRMRCHGCKNALRYDVLRLICVMIRITNSQDNDTVGKKNFLVPHYTVTTQL